MKFMAKNFITILSLLVTIIVSVTAYAYNREVKTIHDKINIETQVRKSDDIKLRFDYQNDMKIHRAKHESEKADRIIRDETFYKYLDQRFDDVEKLINLATK